MKHTKHTPGPWIYSPAVACVFVEQDRIHCPQICTLPAFTPENTANGCLIAAAPDMLAALEKIETDLTALLCERVLDSTLPEFYTVRDARNAARAAIAKAIEQA